MPLPYDKFAAVLVLPSLKGGRVSDPGLQRWLARGSLQRGSAPREVLAAVLQALNLPCPEEGIAALRMWGQTGDRPTVWIAAADPVYLEPRLDHLCLHTLRGDLAPASDLRALFNHLQQALAGNADYGFVRIGNYGYLRADMPLVTAREPAHAIDQHRPDEYLPSGDVAASYHTLRSEVEMALHDHEVNRRREEQGLPPVNSLWLWGGGFAPQQETEPQPPLFSNDPLLRGYWLSRTGVVGTWPGSIAGCLEASVAGFVAMPEADADDPDALQTWLSEIRDALGKRRISRAILLLEDGDVLQIRRADAWKFWRRSTTMFAAAE